MNKKTQASTDSWAIELEVVHALAARLIENKLTITTAESCTGGMIAAALTSIAGSSAFFSTGIVSYSNATKQRLLDVPTETLAEHGAVSEAVVLAMAEGARRRDDAAVAVAVSGVAGPGGGSAEKPVGTVWIAWSISVQQKSITEAEHFVFDGDRDAVRRSAVLAALRGTIARLTPGNELTTKDLPL